MVTNLHPLIPLPLNNLRRLGVVIILLLYYGQELYNCPKCDKAYKRVNDLRRHMIKHNPILFPQNQPITNSTTTTHTRTTQSQTDQKVTPISSTIKKHTSTNTRIIHTKDKATNTEPLIIMTPKELTKLDCGATLITFDRSMQIYMSTLNSTITPISNTPSQVLTPNTTVPSLNEACQHQQLIKRKGAEINSTLQNSLNLKKAKLSDSTKTNLKINKQRKSTKKIVQHLTDKYTPLSRHLSKLDKQFSHILGEAPAHGNNMVITTHQLPKDDPVAKPVGGHQVQENSSHKPAKHNCPHTVTQAHTQKVDSSPDELINSAPQDQATHATAVVGSHHSHTSINNNVCIDFSTDFADLVNHKSPDNTGTRSPAKQPLIQANYTPTPTTQQMTKDDWESLLKLEYSPSNPEYIPISSDEEECDVAEVDNVDPGFRAKLMDLFGPVSP